MVGGQALDLLGEDRALGTEDLDALHERKTGALLSAAPALGGEAAETSDARVAALARYGRQLGLAFQIADDLLDATGTAEELGKKPSDRDLAKSTYVSHYGIPEARRRARQRAGKAREALREQGIRAPLLHALAEYVVRRRS